MIFDNFTIHRNTDEIKGKTQVKCKAMQLIPMLFGGWSSHCFLQIHQIESNRHYLIKVWNQQNKQAGYNDDGEVTAMTMLMM